MLGIEKLKEAATEITRFGERIEDITKDGKVTIAEGFSVAVATAPGAFSLIQDAKEIKAEYLDLDDAERDELVDHVVSELDLEADNIEAIAEAGFDVLLSLDALIGTIRAGKEA